MVKVLFLAQFAPFKWRYSQPKEAVACNNEKNARMVCCNTGLMPGWQAV
jgi:hypothetical protein